MSSSHLFFGLPCGHIDIGFHLHTFLPFSLPAFSVNGQTSLIVVLLCDLLCSYVLLFIKFIVCFHSPCTISSFLQDQKSFLTLSFQIPGGFSTRTILQYCQLQGRRSRDVSRDFLGFLALPYILESNPHSFYSFRGLKIRRGLESRYKYSKVTIRHNHKYQRNIQYIL